METAETLPLGFSRDKKHWETVEQVTALPTETLLAEDGVPQFDIIRPDTPAGKRAVSALLNLCSQIPISSFSTSPPTILT